MYFRTSAPTASELVRAREARREERRMDEARLERAREMERHRASARARMRRERDAVSRTTSPPEARPGIAAAVIYRTVGLNPDNHSTLSSDPDPRPERARTLGLLEGGPATTNGCTSDNYPSFGYETEDELDATGLDLTNFTLSRLDDMTVVMTDRTTGRVITANVDGSEAHMLTFNEPMQYFRLHELRQLQGRMAAAGWM